MFQFCQTGHAQNPQDQMFQGTLSTPTNYGRALFLHPDMSAHTTYLSSLFSGGNLGGRHPSCRSACQLQPLHKADSVLPLATMPLSEGHISFQSQKNASSLNPKGVRLVIHDIDMHT